LPVSIQLRCGTASPVNPANEAIKILKENIIFLKDAIPDLQQQIKEATEPFVGGEVGDIKLLRLYFDMTLIQLKVVTETLDGQFKIIEVIQQRLDEK